MNDGRATVPYGEWSSPISAADVARGGVTLGLVRLVGDAVWWTERRPHEAGRSVVCRRDPAGTVVDVVPATSNVRTRVHEYGGQAWQVLRDGSLIYAEFDDQRLYRLDPGPDGTGGTPRPITPEPPTPSGWRYADLVADPDGGSVICVRETVDGGEVSRDLVRVPTGGGEPTVLWTGAHFISSPALSADGGRLAWTSWEHPDMPWDATRLHVAEVGWDGGLTDVRTVAGIDRREAIQQPQWASDGTLYAITDRTGWWNLHRLDGDDLVVVVPMEQECGHPQWQFGVRSYALLDGLAVLQHGSGSYRWSTVDLATGARTELGLPYTSRSISMDADRATGRVALVGFSPRTAGDIAVLDATTGAYEVVRHTAVDVPEAYLPEPRQVTLPSTDGRVVHAHVYPPTSPDHEAPAGELPPYVVWTHGGPTSQASTALDLEVAYFTSRGVGVVDVDYGGSTGYGRGYREVLRGQWGVVDVEDCVAVARALVAEGAADERRLAIRGGSAGGWTTLCCLTRTDVFAAGASYFGVADAVALAEHTHDFESRYLDSMIGPLPEARAVYDERSPLAHVDELSCPVLLLQGLDDPVVAPAQAEVFVDAMVRKGIPHAYLAFEGESHGFRRADTQIRALEGELSFYGQVMGFSPPDMPKLDLSYPSPVG